MDGWMGWMYGIESNNIYIYFIVLALSNSRILSHSYSYASVVHMRNVATTLHFNVFSEVVATQ